ncbi:hypothetical protein SESBI_32255 [Sesbania bispinosa]|nr:hypothetical protein SESBI_32255 [Sesbania bispinosa]
MVGFCDLSDTEESAVEEIISQAQDACVLDQLSAINCAGITHSVLPSDLDSRFRKLKSFPAKRTTPPPYDAKARSFSTLNSTNLHDPLKDGKRGLKGKPKHGSLSPPFGSASGSSHTSEESSISSLFKPTQKDEGKHSKQKSLSSPLRSSNSLMSSPSPPRKTGCFCLSSKQQQKMLKKAMKEEEKINREAEKIVEWAKHASARMDVSGIEDELSDD